MNEIKVKAYGLVNFTKRQYLITQGIVFAILIAIFTLSFVSDLSASENIVLRYLGVGSVIAMALELLETMFMLRRFTIKLENYLAETTRRSPSPRTG